MRRMLTTNPDFQSAPRTLLLGRHDIAELMDYPSISTQSVTHFAPQLKGVRNRPRRSTYR